MTNAPWIWLNSEKYPDRQHGRYTGAHDRTCKGDTVAELSRTYDFGKRIERIELKYSADAISQLWLCGRFLGTGPVLIGGDFFGNDKPRSNRYHTELTIQASGEDDPLSRVIVEPRIADGQVDILARVRLNPTQIDEFSVGRGGFMLCGRVFFEDGEVADIVTDESWDAALCPAYYVPMEYDGRLPRENAGKAVAVQDVWHTTASPLPLRIERRLELDGGNIHLGARETKHIEIELEKLRAGYLHVITHGDATVTLTAHISEMKDDPAVSVERLTLCGNDDYLGAIMYSFGLLKLDIANHSDSDARLDISVNEAYLPSAADARTETSLPWLNNVLDVCRHTLKYCRQYIHLDSPKHCEPMACTGDYFIETLMSSYSYGDMTLADFDVVRTARLLEHNGGVMFHPTYSLIWVRMMLEVYLRCGRLGLLQDCRTALDMLLEVFRGYIGENGLIETPQSFMFVDWIYIDGISLHHPPKALGQSVINMFYYDALAAAEQIYTYLGDESTAERTRVEKIAIKDSIKANLYDSERGLFFEGLNTPSPADAIWEYLPENIDKRYYRINANALAAAFGVIDGEEAKALMRRVMDDPSFDDYQPYFAHFVLGAIHRTGLDGEYLLRVLEKWKAPVEDCPKGLAEGFIPPEPTYVFDHSHAWGGTPLFSLPNALCSLQILEPGMAHISILPRLCGLNSATVEIPTPYGIVRVEMAAGNGDGAPMSLSITAPRAVKVDIRD